MTDNELTSFKSVHWEISRSSFEFSPHGVKTKKTEFGTTTFDLNEKNLTTEIYTARIEAVKTKIIKDKFSEKRFQIDARAPTIFQLNTFNFPGWKAYLNGKRVVINDNNKFKLITVLIPKGEYELKFVFEDTFIRRTANIISLMAVIICLLVIKYKK